MPTAPCGCDIAIRNETAMGSISLGYLKPIHCLEDIAGQDPARAYRIAKLSDLDLRGAIRRHLRRKHIGRALHRR